MAKKSDGVLGDLANLPVANEDDMPEKLAEPSKDDLKIQRDIGELAAITGPEGKDIPEYPGMRIITR